VTGTYTPHPWKRLEAKPLDSDGSMSIDIVGRNGEFIAQLQHQLQLEDNANLIAAAPDLLMALDGLLTRYESICEHRKIACDMKVVNAARTAIARALGRVVRL